MRPLDREGHADVELLEVAGVLNRDLEREIRRRGDLVLRRAPAGGQRLPVRKRFDGHERAPVFAADRAAGGGAVHALPDDHHRLRAREVGIREDRRVGNPADVADVLALELGLRRLLEVDVPVHVARDEEQRLVCDQPSGSRRILGRRRLTEGVGEAHQRAGPQLQHLDQVVMLDA